MKPVELRIPYPTTEEGRKHWNSEYSLNSIYSGKHYGARRRDKQYWTQIVTNNLYKQKIPKIMFIKPVRITFFWNDNLDLSNDCYMAKMIEDVLKKWVIFDDNKKHVVEIYHKIHSEAYILVRVEEVG